MEKFNPTSSRKKPSSHQFPPASESASGPSAGSAEGEVYKPVGSMPNFSKMEHRILGLWEETQAFRKRVDLNRDGDPWSFMDGPKTANNPLGVHHAWGRTLKDLFQRYRAMQGYDLRYQNGFDCQGLWVEVEVEKELGFKSKRDIERLGVAEFVKECKKRVLRYAGIIVRQSVRLGCWMDWDDTEFLHALSALLDLPNDAVEIEGPMGVLHGTPEEIVGMLGDVRIGGSYFTLSDENNYSIWGLLKRCHENGWIYKGTDVVPWCPRCSTALSEHEITTEGYRELTHPSIYVKLPLRDRPGEYLLVWTTTPWTLSSNVAVAVHPDLTYVKVRSGKDCIYLAESLVSSVLGNDAQIIERMMGRQMKGWQYAGPFDHLEAIKKANVDQYHRVVLWEEVSGEEGTGIVHIAPGCGKEDFELGKGLDLPLIAPLDGFGVFVPGFGPMSGIRAEETAPIVVEDLQERGFLFRGEDYTHRYPVCWRCESELVFRLVDEWFIAMDKPPKMTNGSQTLRERIIGSAREVTWIPSFGLKRELDWLGNMGDWMISKKRYWGLTLPIWECRRCGAFDVIGSREELRERAIRGWDQFGGHSPHRPWVDLIKIRCEKCGSEADRVPDVGNPWMDAGIVSFSTLGYFGDRRAWKKWFPAEMVCESFRGQFRNWFYAMLTMSTILEGRAPFKVCLGHGDVRDEYGREMHASLGNAVSFDDAVEEMGADLMRWMYCSMSTAKNLFFSYKETSQLKRRFFLPLWNAYRFFVTYANIDRWKPLERSMELTIMDRWILSRLQVTIDVVTEGLESYEPQRCTRQLEDFVSDLSRWYLRSSRRRFWKNETDADKHAAYFTLYKCLVTVAKLLAPFTPFLSEEIFQNLVRPIDRASEESVHHTDWPSVDSSLVDSELDDAMALAMRIGELGRSVRARSGIKLRQPLREAIVVAEPEVLAVLAPLSSILEGELNVGSLRLADHREEGFEYATSAQLEVGVDIEIDEALLLEGLARDIVRRIQKQRRDADLKVDDLITTNYVGDPMLERAMEEKAAYIGRETLSFMLARGKGSTMAHKTHHRIQGMDLSIAIERREEVETT